MEGLSNSDVALLSERDGMSGNSAFFWIFALLLLAGGGFGGFGGNRGDYVTRGDLNAQSSQQQMGALAVQTANQNYETAQLIHAQTNEMLQQNNTNLINAIQGFNSLGLQINNQTNVLSQQIQALAAQMNQCCCDIKTQMLQDRLSDTQAKLVTAQNAIDNANQSQYILGQLGRFVAWAGSGSQTVAAAG